ncbi:MAG: hypothetical protein WBX38_08920 [Candidatus Sulfotelmatobacter sp.]
MSSGNNSSATASSSANPQMRWAALAGLWNFEDASATYTGPSSEAAQSYGIALSSCNLTDGSISVHLKFSQIDTAGNTSAGLILGFQSERSRYVIAQIGGYGRAYSLAEWLPGFGWQGIENTGSARNLDSTKEYEISVRQTGQEIRMSVGGVPVIERVLGQPLDGNQVGLFAWGKSEIRFSELKISSTKPQVFVAMQFGLPYDTLYQQVISPSAKSLGLTVERIDEVAGPGIIFEDIKRHISEAKIVIAEITAPNQNVFYELGYAHALNKPTILLAQRGKELPFDIRSYRVIFYDDTIGGKPAVEQALQKHLETILHEG